MAMSPLVTEPLNIGELISRGGANIANAYSQGMAQSAQRYRDETARGYQEQQEANNAVNLVNSQEAYQQAKMIQAVNKRTLTAHLMSFGQQLDAAGDDPIAKSLVYQTEKRRFGKDPASLYNKQAAANNTIMTQAMADTPEFATYLQALLSVGDEPVVGPDGKVTTLDGLSDLMGTSEGIKYLNDRNTAIPIKRGYAELYPDSIHVDSRGVAWGKDVVAQVRGITKAISENRATIEDLNAFDSSLYLDKQVSDLYQAEAKKQGISLDTPGNGLAYGRAVASFKLEDRSSNPKEMSLQDEAVLRENMVTFRKVADVNGEINAEQTSLFVAKIGRNATKQDIVEISDALTKIGKGMGPGYSDKIKPFSPQGILALAEHIEYPGAASAAVRYEPLKKYLAGADADPEVVTRILIETRGDFNAEDNINARYSGAEGFALPVLTPGSGNAEKLLDAIEKNPDMTPGDVRSLGTALEAEFHAAGSMSKVTDELRISNNKFFSAFSIPRAGKTVETTPQTETRNEFNFKSTDSTDDALNIAVDTISPYIKALSQQDPKNEFLAKQVVTEKRDARSVDTTSLEYANFLDTPQNVAAMDKMYSRMWNVAKEDNDIMVGASQLAKDLPAVQKQVFLDRFKQRIDKDIRARSVKSLLAALSSNNKPQAVAGSTTDFVLQIHVPALEPDESLVTYGTAKTVEHVPTKALFRKQPDGSYEVLVGANVYRMSQEEYDRKVSTKEENNERDAILNMPKPTNLSNATWDAQKVELLKVPVSERTKNVTTVSRIMGENTKLGWLELHDSNTGMKKEDLRHAQRAITMGSNPAATVEKYRTSIDVVGGRLANAQRLVTIPTGTDVRELDTATALLKEGYKQLKENAEGTWYISDIENMAVVLDNISDNTNGFGGMGGRKALKLVAEAYQIPLEALAIGGVNTSTDAKRPILYKDIQLFKSPEPFRYARGFWKAVGRADDFYTLSQRYAQNRLETFDTYIEKDVHDTQLGVPFYKFK